ncbi:hypothetical protein K505DRAFT_382976 [Melanomma pulvis-pyrius CBS 109.77]|uniref:F-box domain-containing protein n=1 Tax=Melanomma pulvis-pyrius CBS 109.77 TaxID=1314802 RepID=A0A6A6XET0_9PLEO|nr:hypothetical protein K505DRAFT_382976 [Melanomma pulvis-pyrius CBS 109.77]
MHHASDASLQTLPVELIRSIWDFSSVPELNEGPTLAQRKTYKKALTSLSLTLGKDGKLSPSVRSLKVTFPAIKSQSGGADYLAQVYLDLLAGIVARCHIVVTFRMGYTKTDAVFLEGESVGGDPVQNAICQCVSLKHLTYLSNSVRTLEDCDKEINLGLFGRLFEHQLLESLAISISMRLDKPLQPLRKSNALTTLRMINSFVSDVALCAIIGDAPYLKHLELHSNPHAVVAPTSPTSPTSPYEPYDASNHGTIPHRYKFGIKGKLGSFKGFLNLEHLELAPETLLGWYENATPLNDILPNSIRTLRFLPDFLSSGIGVFRSSFWEPHFHRAKGEVNLRVKVEEYVQSRSGGILESISHLRKPHQKKNLDSAHTYTSPGIFVYFGQEIQVKTSTELWDVW